MTDSADFPIYEFDEVAPEARFANDMVLSVNQAMLGSFAKSLWAVAITTDMASLSVDCYMWFDAEPTWLDRDEMAEFASAFDALQPTSIGFDIHWMTISYAHAELRDPSLRWIFKDRNPARRLPDDFVESDLRY